MPGSVDPADVTGWGARHAHDPTAVRDDDGTFYLFSTDAYSGGPVRAGVQVRRSRDLVDWEFHGWAIDGVPEAGARWSGAAGLWAPDVVRVGDEWRMYWSASTFGSRTSAIGLAVAERPTGPWADRGLVVTSLHDVDGPNAIDANAVVDADGRHWLAYGSFFGGIHVLELDPATGLALDGEPADGLRPGACVARRAASVEGAVEGAFVLPRPGGGHAMLVSYDSLFSTYHLRAGVAAHVAGPYRDRAGRLLTDVAADPGSVGTTILASHQLVGGRAWLAPGHASVLTTPSPGGGEHQLLVHQCATARMPPGTRRRCGGCCGPARGGPWCPRSRGRAPGRRTRPPPAPRCCPAAGRSCPSTAPPARWPALGRCCWARRTWRPRRRTTARGASPGGAGPWPSTRWCSPRGTASASAPRGRSRGSTSTAGRRSAPVSAMRRLRGGTRRSSP